MRAIRATVPREAVLQVPKIRPHRNPVQGNNSMWLLCAGARHPGMPIEIESGDPKEMRDLPGRPRSMEPPMPNEERRNPEGQNRLRDAPTVSPSHRTEGSKEPARDAHYYEDPIDTDNRINTVHPSCREQLPTEKRTKESEQWNNGRSK